MATLWSRSCLTVFVASVKSLENLRLGSAFSIDSPANLLNSSDLFCHGSDAQKFSLSSLRYAMITYCRKGEFKVERKRNVGILNTLETLLNLVLLYSIVLLKFQL
jgi:hypothetical protein